MLVPLSKAAVLVGISRKTIYRHHAKNRFSVSYDKKGLIVVDTSELIRVYGEISSPDTPPLPEVTQGETVLLDEIKAIRNEFSASQKELLNRISDLEKEVKGLRLLPSPLDNIDVSIAEPKKKINSFSDIIAKMKKEEKIKL